MEYKNMIWFGLLFILLSCESETITVDDIPTGKEYYPLTIGNSWEYEYDSIVYDASLGRVDTLSGLIHEELSESIDNSRYVINRSWRKDMEDSWTETDRWVLVEEEHRIIKIEENLPFIKLVFPLSFGLVWEGNSLFEESTSITVAGETLIPYFNWNYEVIADDQVYSQQGISAENVMHILQVNDTTNLELRFSEEFYAPNIGLVEKKLSILDCNCFGTDRNIPWEQKAEKGFIFSQRLIKYTVQ
jgi:hypothetical protein